MKRLLNNRGGQFWGRLGGIVWALGACLAWSSPKAKVVVLPWTAADPSLTAAAEQYTRTVREALSGREDRWLLLNPGGPAASVSDGSGAEARKRLSQAEVASKEKRWEDALELFRTGLELAFREPGAVETERWRLALRQLAEVQFREGDAKGAQETLLQLLRMDENHVLPVDAPPVFARELDRARRRLNAQPRGVLLVEAEVGTSVALDGAKRMEAPARFEAVPVGRHFVHLIRPGSPVAGFSLEIRPGMQSHRVDESKGMDPVVFRPGRQVGSEDLEVLGRLAKAAGADWVLWGMVYSASPSELAASGVLFGRSFNAVVGLSTVRFDSLLRTASVEAYKMADEALIRTEKPGPPLELPHFLTPALTAPIALPAPSEWATPTASAAAGEASAKRKVPVWVWAVAGAAVAAGAGVGGYYLIRHVNRPVTGTVTATW